MAPMELGQELKEALGIALNEATLLGVELDASGRRVAVTLRVLALPDGGEPMPSDCRVQLVFAPVGRVAVSLRGGNWADPAAPVIPVAADEILSVVQTFGGLPIYGWEFFDTADLELQKWGDRLSLDWRSGVDGASHSVVFFQEGVDRHLDLIVWFDAFVVRDSAGLDISITDFVGGGRRWWTAFRGDDPRTQGFGMGNLSS